MTSNLNYYIRILFKNRIFTYDEINMNQQINISNIITAYEYDKLYFMVHRAFAHYFTNNSQSKNPKQEDYPYLEENNLQKIYEFLDDYEDEKKRNSRN